MPALSYRTIAEPSESIYKEKGSKFLAFAYPVSSTEEIKMRLDTLKRIHFDANHHCFAFMLGAEKHLFRAADDGEPNHSAGDPILSQIRSRDLTDVLVVVVRYFGGTKLGVSGLISAYKAAAGSALDQIKIVTKAVKRRVTIRYPFANTSDVMKLVKDFDLHLIDQQFGECGTLLAEYKLEIELTLSEKLQLFKTLGYIEAWTKELNA